MTEYAQPVCYIKYCKINVWSKTHWCNQVDSNKFNKANVINCFASDCWIKSRSNFKRLDYVLFKMLTEVFFQIFPDFNLLFQSLFDCFFRKNTLRQMLVRFVWCVKTVFCFITHISFFVPYLLLNLEDLQCEKDIVLWCDHVD